MLDRCKGGKYGKGKSGIMYWMWSLCYRLPVFQYSGKWRKGRSKRRICPANAVSIEGYDMEDMEEYDEETFKVDPENLLRAIKFRRSIRFYKDEKVTEKDLHMLAQAGRYTATAKNNQDCHFVFVQEERDELKERVWGYIDALGKHVDKALLPYVAFNRRRLNDPTDDYLFRNAPVVLFVTSVETLLSDVCF